MPSTVQKPALTKLDNLPVNHRPVMAKVTTPDNFEGLPLSGVVKDSAKRAHGKQGVAASVLGKDEGNFARDVSAGRTTLKELAQLGPQFLAELGKGLTLQYGELALTPLQHAEQKLDEIQAAVNDVRQSLRQIA